MYTKIKYKGHTVNLLKGAYEVVKDKCNGYYDSNLNKHMFNSKLDLDINSDEDNKPKK